MLDADNPLASRSLLPYGLPDWDRIRPEHYLPAITAGMQLQRERIAALTRMRSMPTFENTIEAWERSGEELHRAASTFFTVSSADATEEIQAIEAELAPLLAAHNDAIMLDGALFDRVRTIHDNAALRAHLTPEQSYLLDRRFQEMSLAGAGLDADTKVAVAALNARLAELTTEFDRRLLADTNALAPLFLDADQLAGMDASGIATAHEAAGARGVDGYLLKLPLPTGHPLLAVLSDRDSRQTVMDHSRARGTTGAHETWSVLAETVRTRAERARLLGYDSHAAYVTADETAGTPQAVVELLRRLAAPTANNAADEADARRAISGLGEGFGAADWAGVTEQLRRAEYDVDTDALRAYFEAERVLVDGVFFAAHELYGLTFTERPDLHGYHPEVRVFEVAEEDGSPLGLYLLDLYTRDTKRGGAWMNEVVAPVGLFEDSPVVMNNLNVVRPSSGPTLLTFDEVTTLFHEFGHALHGLFARATYPHLAGTNVFRDFVEFPSQVNEMWMLWPEVLDSYARHYETNEPIDPAIVARIRESGAFNQGFATSEYLQAAWLDFAWHSVTAGEEIADGPAFECAALEEIGLYSDLIPPRYASTYFQHVFSGGYSAGYYSYIWSEVLDADTVAWFEENGGLNRENGHRFRERLLAVAGQTDPLAAYRDFRGADADIAHLLRRRGLDG